MNYLEIIRIGLLALCCFCLLFDLFKSSKVGKFLSSSIQNILSFIQNILIRCFDENKDIKELEYKEDEENKTSAKKVDFEPDSFLNFLRVVNGLASLKLKDEKDFLGDKK